MKSLFSLATALLATVATASAVTVSLNFDSAASVPTDASAFAPSIFTINNAVFVGATDPLTLDVGPAYWQIDAASDASFPVQVDSPSANGWGAAPSGSNALDARFQSVILKFNGSYLISSFSVTLDNSTQGDLGTSSISFVLGTSTVTTVGFDQGVSGAVVTLGAPITADGIVLPGNAFYDNIVINASAIPEPSTYAAAFGGVALAGAALARRRRQA